MLLNSRDTEVCMGEYGHHKTIEIVPMSDCCGLIAKLRPGASELGLKEGDSVASIFIQTHLTGQIVEKDMASGLGLPLNGSLMQYRIFPAYGLVKVPDYLTDGKDKVVLLQGTGSVDVGATDCQGIRIDHSQADRRPRRGDVVQTLGKSLRCVAFGGLINAVGYLSGKEEATGDRFNANVLALSRNVTFKGIINGPKDRFEEVLRFYAGERIELVINRTFGFEEADEALECLLSGAHFGKVVVKVHSWTELPLVSGCHVLDISP
ncbi:hypothetical protein E0Z10_g4414 [Xylaria hypoxylon]|uniref:Alcohol dehydrogenase-like N-terminal domain-containing protein n=1 Tax=Xylaria hypoxylon TaxID=37992 RepID=A0A4Z0YYX3_9PEZI|nr:hypothetical protein E0Z10_g4414 [Xylaria hypoxylon]